MPLSVRRPELESSRFHSVTPYYDFAMTEQGFILLVSQALTPFPIARALARPESFDYWGLIAVVALGFAILALRIGTAINRRAWKDRLLDQKREMRRRARDQRHLVERRMHRGGRAMRQTADQSTPLILVVQCEATVRSDFRSMLPNSYRIAEAGSTTEAVQMARLLAPELVIVDGTKSAASAMRCCGVIKNNPELCHIPTMLASPPVSPHLRLQAVQEGIDAILTTPIVGEEFVAQIDHLVGSRRLLRERYRSEVLLKPFEVVISSSELTFVERVYDAVNKHLEDGSFTVGRLAREVGVSESQLKRKLRALIDESPVDLIRRIRLERAAELLRNRAGNVGDVAFATGFTNLSYFAKCFRAHWGVTPSQFLLKVKHEQTIPILSDRAVH